MKNFWLTNLTFFSLFLISLFYTFTSYAADCLTYQDSYYSNGLNANINRYVDYETSIETCQAQVILQSYEYQELLASSNEANNLTEILTLLFAFDVQTFAVVEFALIMAFLTSHFAGRVVRWLGK